MRGWSFVAVGLWVSACSASDSGSAPGTSADSGPDVTFDAPADTGSDATDGAADSGSDAPADALPSDASDAGDASACTLTKPYSSKNTACNDCAQQHCCEAVNACYADPDCDDGYVNCILACALLPDDAGDAGVAACIADCDQQYPKGKQEYDAAIGCADSQCATVCQ